jgi:hypothetical protein
MSFRKTLIAYLFSLLSFCSYGQIADEYVSSDSIVVDLTERKCNSFSKRATRKCDRLAARIRKSTDDYFLKFETLEEGILMNICQTDERHAESLIRGSLYSFRRLESMQTRKMNEPLGANIPELDSLNLAADYLIERDIDSDQRNSDHGKSNAQTTSREKCSCEGLSELKKSQANLRAEIKRAELIQSHIKERSNYISGLSEQYPQLGKSIQSLEKVNYYMSAQSNEYMNLFADRSRPEKLLFGSLNKIPGFSEFASLKNQIPQTNALTGDVAGQTMDIAMAEFKSAAQNKGMDPMKLLNQSVGLKNFWSKKDDVKSSIAEARQNTESAVTEIKDEYETIKSDSTLKDSRKEEIKNEIDESSDENWKPNQLKTKRFVDRLTYGTSLQASPRTTFFPTAGTFSMQAAYSITTRMSVGVGSSYIAGFAMSSTSDDRRKFQGYTNGMGFRSYLDWNVKYNLYAVSGYEVNYRADNITNGGQIDFKELGTQQFVSCVAGIKLKKSSTKRNLATMEILYDFMAQKTGQPSLMMRMGMEFLPKHGFKK